MTFAEVEWGRTWSVWEVGLRRERTAKPLRFLDLGNREGGWEQC